MNSASSSRDSLSFLGSAKTSSMASSAVTSKKASRVWVKFVNFKNRNNFSNDKVTRYGNVGHVGLFRVTDVCEGILSLFHTFFTNLCLVGWPVHLCLGAKVAELFPKLDDALLDDVDLLERNSSVAEFPQTQKLSREIVGGRTQVPIVFRLRVNHVKESF